MYVCISLMLHKQSVRQVNRQNGENADNRRKTADQLNDHWNDSQIAVHSSTSRANSRQLYWQHENNNNKEPKNGSWKQYEHTTAGRGMKVVVEIFTFLHTGNMYKWVLVIRQLKCSNCWKVTEPTESDETYEAFTSNSLNVSSNHSIPIIQLFEYK